MTVQELIAELQKHPLDMRVVVNGHEMDYDDIKDVSVIGVYLDNNSIYTWQGKHGHRDDPPVDPNATITDVLYIQPDPLKYTDD